MLEKEKKIQKALGTLPTIRCDCCNRLRPIDEVYGVLDSKKTLKTYVLNVGISNINVV